MPPLMPPTKRRAFGLILPLMLLLNLTPGGGAAPRLAPPPAAAQAEAHNIRSFFYPTGDLIVDPSTQTIYASVPSTAGANGNSITPLDPTTGTLGAPVFVGSEPGRMALSDNGQYLYVSLDGAAAVRRYDVAARTAGLQYPLGEEVFDGPLFVNDLNVMPGNPGVVAVSRRNGTGSPSFEGVAVYDDGVRRPNTTPGHTGSEFIEFSSPTSLHGAGFGGLVEQLTVSASGVAIDRSTRMNIGNTDLRHENGRLYFPSGQVVNAQDGTLVGTYSIPDPFTNISHGVVPDASVGRVYILTGSSGDFFPRTMTLRVFDQQTFVPLGTLEIAGVIGNPTSLVRWGANGLAFRTSGNQVFLIQTTLIPSTTPVPQQTPTPIPTPTPNPTPTPTPAPGELRQLPVTAKDIVIDPASQLIYASVPSSAGVSGNSVATIEPASGTVGTPVFIGSEPGKLALSDNSQYLYVSLEGARAVRRFDIASGTAGPQFSLGTDEFGSTLSLQDLAVAPGHPETVAIARTSDRSGPTAAIYDNGVPRPISTGVFNTINQVEYSASADVLYGLDTVSSADGFRRLGVGPCGALVLSVRSDLVNAFASEFKVVNGRAYSHTGQVADPEAGLVVGRYRVMLPEAFGIFRAAVVVDPVAGRVYFLAGSSVLFSEGPRAVRLSVFDLHTFLPLGVMDIPNITGGPTAVVRWGSNGLAFRTDSNHVYLLQNSLVAPTGNAVVPAPTPAPPTRSVSGNLSLPLSGVTMSLSGDATGSTTTDAAGRFSIGGLPLCGSYTVTPTSEGHSFSPASVTVTPANNNNPNQVIAFFNVFPKTVRFSQPSLSISEGAGSAPAVVTRTGDVSKAATVFYQTADGTASERGDYQTAVGALNFAPGESTKPITLFINDDARAESAETFTITLSDPTGAQLGTISSVNVTITDNDATDGPSNPADDAQFFVRQHYLDFLGRQHDAEGLAFWMNEITSCGADAACREVKRVNVSAAFFLSIEFQETGYLAYRTYKAAFGDATSPGVPGTVPAVRLREFLADAGRIGQGVRVGIGDWFARLEANKDAYVLEFVQRPRFVSDFPLSMTADEFVTKLDERAGGVLSPAERAQLVADLGATPGDAAKRAAVLRRVAEDGDLRQRETNRAFVLMQYYGYLRRNPDDPQDTNFGGWRFWLDKLEEHHGNFVTAEMVRAFISSIEYRQRFGQ